jgi:hypothetical protein
MGGAVVARVFRRIVGFRVRALGVRDLVSGDYKGMIRVVVTQWCVVRGGEVARAPSAAASSR